MPGRNSVRASAGLPPARIRPRGWSVLYLRTPRDPFVPRPIRLITLAPGHFHASLVQKHAAPGVHPRAYVYAPLDDDLLAHLGLVADFNRRADRPTACELS